MAAYKKSNLILFLMILRYPVAIVFLFPFGITIRTWNSGFGYPGHGIPLSDEGHDILYSLLPNIFVLAFLIHAICAIVFWHIIFIPALFSFLSSKRWRAMVKSVDYLWYTAGAFLVVVFINDFGLAFIDRDRSFIERERAGLQSVWENEFQETVQACDVVAKYTDLGRDGIPWAQSICDTHFTGSKRALNGIVETCTAEGEVFYPTNDQRFDIGQDNSTDTKDALNQIHYYCFAHVRHHKLSKDLAGYDVGENNLIKFPTTSPGSLDPAILSFYYVIFAFVVGAKLSKTSVDVVSEWKK